MDVPPTSNKSTHQRSALGQGIIGVCISVLVVGSAFALVAWVFIAANASVQNWIMDLNEYVFSLLHWSWAQQHLNLVFDLQVSASGVFVGGAYYYFLRRELRGLRPSPSENDPPPEQS